MTSSVNEWIITIILDVTRAAAAVAMMMMLCVIEDVALTNSMLVFFYRYLVLEKINKLEGRMANVAQDLPAEINGKPRNAEWLHIHLIFQ